MNCIALHVIGLYSTELDCIALHWLVVGEVSSSIFCVLASHCIEIEMHCIGFVVGEKLSKIALYCIGLLLERCPKC